ncbi:Hypothetical protein PYTT_1044 [Akkermansia glycaniphila]|uniref:Uncharacterized protein n=1 Tax=Akkermansia glycaniphila TaxID=1679444 RepID=A0A1H6L3A0_9BACT|nr:Hypothetical protein PYTT_1044 [Akkermansia glycaniphila]
MTATFEAVETAVLVRGQGKNGKQLQGGDWNPLKHDIQ